ncbi:hypothetical protein VNO78_00432 [Psophocarpus tetragonolobus]|uniref:Uncharacterized protein n=1 Tax=Psophocarpus tetragonolobus TaxID=3891 RepID=A0AAN9XTS5_PSOTE
MLCKASARQIPPCLYRVSLSSIRAVNPLTLDLLREEVVQQLELEVEEEGRRKKEERSRSRSSAFLATVITGLV